MDGAVAEWNLIGENDRIVMRMKMGGYCGKPQVPFIAFRAGIHFVQDDIVFC